MKKLLLINFLIFLYSFTWGQSAPLVVSTKVTINSVTVFTDPYTVTGVTNDVTSNWTASDISAGDSLYLEDGSELRVYQVVSISSAVGTAFTIVINDLNDTGSLPTTGVGALYRGTTNYDYPVWTAGISETLQSMIDNRFKQRLDALLKGIGTDYITTDSFSTFTNGASYASIPLNKTVWSTTRGSKWEKTGVGTMTRRSTDNGLNASTIANTSNDSIQFNSNLNNRVQMTTGNVSNAYVLDPLYYTLQAVGETFVIGIQAGSSDVTVNWSSVFGIYTGTTFSGMLTTIVPAQSVMTFTFRVITTSSEVTKFHYVDGININTETSYSFTDTGHGYTSGDVGKLGYLNASGFQLARSDYGVADSVAQYFIVSVPDVNTIKIATSGRVTKTHAFAVGSYLYLSTTAGEYTNVQPTSTNAQYVGRVPADDVIDILIDDLSNAQVPQSSESLVQINAQTGTTYTLVAGDIGKLVTMTNASANTLTIPPNASVAFEVGAKINIAQFGSGQTTIAPGSGVTINSADSANKTRVIYSTCSLIKTATDTWLLAGDITI